MSRFAVLWHHVALADLMSKKPNYHHGDLRKALLDAGEEVLAELGFRGFTLRECARRAEVSHAAPKHHFADVRGLLTAIAARGFQRLTEALQGELAPANDLEEEFEATLRAYAGFAGHYPEHFRVMFRSDVVDQESRELQVAAAQTFTVLTNVILRQTGKPEIDCEDVLNGPMVESVFDDIAIGWCHIHGFAHLQLEQQLKPWDDEALQAIMHTSSRRLSALLQGR